MTIIKFCENETHKYYKLPKLLNLQPLLYSTEHIDRKCYNNPNRTDCATWLSAVAGECFDAALA